MPSSWPEDRHGPLHARGLPPGGRLQRGEHRVEAGAQVLEHVVSVEALPMAGVQRGGRAAHQHGPRHERLQVPLGGQQPLPIRQLVGFHAAIVAPGRGHAHHTEASARPGKGPGCSV